jgi:hypothetical protein
MNACKRWPGRAGAGGSVTGGTIEKRSAAPRGPLDQNAAPTTPPARQSFLARNKCRLPLASGARAKNNADLRGLQTAGGTMPETCRRKFRPRRGSRAQGPCDRLSGACRWPRWSRPRPVVGIGLPVRRPPSPQGEQPVTRFALERSTAEQEMQRRHHASPHPRCGIAIAMGQNRTCI